MKKRIAIASMLLIMQIYLCSCASNQDSLSKKPIKEFLVTKSIELTCTMDNLAQSDEYINLLSASPELRNTVLEIGTDEYLNPNQAVLIKVPNTAIDSIIKNLVGEINLHGDAYEMLVARMCSSVPSIINGQHEVNTIAATSILSVNKAFQQHDDLTDTTYVVLIYDNNNSVTLFRNSDEGIISASASFLFLNDDMKKAVADETVVTYLSEDFNINGIEVEYIDGNAIAK